MKSVILVLAGALLTVAGCAATSHAPSTPSSERIPVQTAGQPGAGQPTFGSDQEVAAALIAALKQMDHEQVHRLLGPAWKELVSGDKVEDAAAFKAFADRAADKTRLERRDDSTSILHVGSDDWPFPIPIVRTSDEKWFLDTESGKDEILARRIGKDELDAIQICRIYVQAQHEYAAEPHDDTDLPKYAQKILSTPGRKDGLYWTVSDSQQPSPLASLIAQAKMEGYEPRPGKRGPYHGYVFRILKRQGANAPGGKYSYVINGNMVAGFALIAFPIEYESSGIMTFMVNQRGKVLQKDLGPNTVDIARQIDEYNPDGSWAPVRDGP